MRHGTDFRQLQNVRDLIKRLIELIETRPLCQSTLRKLDFPS